MAIEVKSTGSTDYVQIMPVRWKVNQDGSIRSGSFNGEGGL